MAATATYSKVSVDDDDEEVLLSKKEEEDRQQVEEEVRATKEEDKGAEEEEEEEKEEEEDDDGPREHVVKDRETLNSIAAFYDLTPSHLAQTNRLSSSSFLFPGKKLVIPARIPDPPKKKEEEEADASDSAAAKKSTRPPPPRCVVEEEEYVVPGAYIKVNVKRVTQGHGCIHGCVLLTTKNFMFCPNPTDPAVHEFQQELQDNFFEIIAPIELVVNLAVFKDLNFDRGFGQVVGSDNQRDYSHLLYVPSPRRRTSKEDEKKSGEDLDNKENEAAVENKKASSSPSEGASAESKNEKKEGEVQEEEEEVVEPGLPDPLYLRVTMGKPVDRKLDRDAGILSDGEQDLKPFYWFMIRPQRARKFYNFVSQSFPSPGGKYGLLDHMAVERGGYEVIREGVAILEAEAGRGTSRASIAQLARQMHETFTSVDLDNCSRQIGESAILGEGDRLRVAARLPAATVVGLDWRLRFSTRDDGYSLSNAYRTMAGYEGPVVMLVEAAGGHVFGAFLTSPPRLTEKFMGTGQCFVFSLRPRFEVYTWKGENEFFFAGYSDCLAVGCAGGKYAIWVDGNLDAGRSDRCATFDNEPLAGEGGDFRVVHLEFWTFTSEGDED